MDSQPSDEQRTVIDRRKRPTSPWDVFRRGGRRIRNRRLEEHRQNYFVDRFSSVTFVWIIALLVLSLVDGVMTLQLVDTDCQELNPLMSYLLGKGMTTFLVGKYVLTAAGLPLLLIYQNFYLFRTPFRVGYLIPLFVALYVILLCYQFGLLHGMLV
jgi:hypothetical protein